MKQFILQCADIPFIISVGNDNFHPWILEDYGGTACEPAAGIQISIDEASEDQDSFKHTRPPDVILADKTLIITHPDYRGAYSLAEERGTIRVSGQEALMAYLRTLLSVVIVEKGGLAIHSSCLRQKDRAYIFSGQSGAGKSTVVKLTDEPVLYSDEITLVRKNASGDFILHHSPFRSEFFTPYAPPVGNIAGLFLLKQDSRVFIEHLPKTNALLQLLANIFFPVTGNNPMAEKVFSLCCDFLNQVPAAELHFKKDNTFWRSIYDEFENPQAKS